MRIPKGPRFTKKGRLNQVAVILLCTRAFNSSSEAGTTMMVQRFNENYVHIMEIT